MHQEWPHYVWLQCIRRDFIEKIGLQFEVGIVHEDMIWTLQIARHASRIAFVAEPQYAYRRNPMSLCNAPTQDRVRQQAAGYVRGLDELLSAAGQERENSAFSHALLRQASLDGEFLLRLLRKEMTDVPSRAFFSRNFINARYSRETLRGARSVSQVWRVVRCWLRMSRLARAQG